MVLHRYGGDPPSPSRFYPLRPDRTLGPDPEAGGMCPRCRFELPCSPRSLRFAGLPTVLRVPPDAMGLAAHRRAPAHPRPRPPARTSWPRGGLRRPRTPQPPSAPSSSPPPPLRRRRVWPPARRATRGRPRSRLPPEHRRGVEAAHRRHSRLGHHPGVAALAELPWRRPASLAPAGRPVVRTGSCAQQHRDPPLHGRRPRRLVLDDRPGAFPPMPTHPPAPCWPCARLPERTPRRSGLPGGPPSADCAGARPAEPRRRHPDFLPRLGRLLSTAAAPTYRTRPGAWLAWRAAVPAALQAQSRRLARALRHPPAHTAAGRSWSPRWLATSTRPRARTDLRTARVVLAAHPPAPGEQPPGPQPRLAAAGAGCRPPEPGCGWARP